MAKMNELDIAAIEQAVRKAVAETGLTSDEPDFIGNRPAFILCQYLKGVGMSNSTTLSELKPFAKQWYELLKDQLEDENGDGLTFAQAWAQIVEVWGKVKHPKRNALGLAKVRAANAPYKIPELDWCDDEKMLYLARVCYELSQPDGAFFISGYEAGDILGKDQKTGRAALIMLQSEGVIRCTKVGNRNKASDYQYVGKTVVHNRPNNDFERKREKMIEDLYKACENR